MKTIAAVIVTYNRKELLVENLKECIRQKRKIDKIIIIDNQSTDGSREYVFSYIENADKIIDYVYMSENKGGAGGFSYGVHYAYSKGYDYIWLMDDDGRPQNSETLSKLIEYIYDNNIQEKAFMINSLVVCGKDDSLSFGVLLNNKPIYKIHEISLEFVPNFVNAFNGTLISKELVKLIGIPREDYFIKGDEKEYLLRAQKFNAYIGTVVNSLYFHPTPYKEGKKILTKRVENNIEVGWKEYYNMRNVCINYSIYCKYSFLKKTRFYLVRLLKIILFGNNKLILIKMISVGYYHSIINRTGIYYLPDGGVLK